MIYTHPEKIVLYQVLVGGYKLASFYFRIVSQKMRSCVLAGFRKKISINAKLKRLCQTVAVLLKHKLIYMYDLSVRYYELTDK
jgi:hypothetical protein